MSAPSQREALAPGLVLFAIMIAHTILETARDALFLARLGPQHLAAAYLAMAAIALVAFAALRRWTRLRDPRNILVAFLSLATVGTAVLAIVIARSPAAVFGLYIWTGLIATLVVPSFWTLLDRAVRVDEAKRLFATIGAAGVVGAIAGSAIASILGRLLAAGNLVIAGALAYGIAAVCAFTFAPRRVVAEIRPHARRAEKLSRSARRYVAILIAIGVVATIALTLADLLFKRVIAQRLPAGDLASTLGAIYAGLNTLGLVIQLVVTRRLLRAWGVGAALAMLPIILATAGFGFAATGAVIAVVASKLGDGALRHSLYRVTSELLYLPVPSQVRDGWKPIADAIVLRGGEAVAALATFGLGVTRGDIHELALVAAGAATLWLFGIPILHRAYIGQFRDTLRAGEVARDARVPSLDAGVAAVLVDALSSPDEQVALPALELLAGRARIPALVLYHHSPAVVARALELLEHEARDDIDHALGYLLDHRDPAIRAAALAATAGRRCERERRLAAMTDPDPRLRAAALVGLIDDPERGDAAVAEVASMVTRSTEERAALAVAIAHAPDRRLHGVLYELLAWHEPEVMRPVMRVLAREPNAVDLDRVLALIAQPAVRAEARGVFLTAGSRGLDRLIAALRDPQTPIALRQHLPRTISRFGSRRAAAALVARLPLETDGVTIHKLLRALGRMRASNPHLRIDRAVVHAHALKAIERADRYAVVGAALRRGTETTSPTARLMTDLIGEELEDALEQAFRALDILDPRRGLRSVHDALRSKDEARRAAAREILGELAPADLHTALLAVIEASPDQLAERAATRFASDDALIVELLSDPSESVRCFAAYHAAEHHATAVLPALAQLRATDLPPLVRQAFEQAEQRLDARA